MRARSLVASLVSLACALASASAQADMIAGWDFSQYFGAGLLTTNGSTFTDTLDANYSNLDPSFGAGAESAAFGSMHMNGQFGSTDVAEGSGLEPFFPTSGSLLSNLGAGVPGSQPFDSFTVLADEGQPFQVALRMTAAEIVQVVFAADLSSVPGLVGTDWSLSLGGQTFAGNALVGIEFSTDGSAYTSFGTFDLGSVDAAFSRNLGTGPSSDAFVRLSFPAPSGGGVGQAIIDNLALNANLVPEPGTALLLWMGLVGMAAKRRRHA